MAPWNIWYKLTHIWTHVLSFTASHSASTKGTHREPESCPPPSTSESTKEEWSSDTEPSQKQKTAHRKQKRCARCDAVPTLYLIEPREPWDEAPRRLLCSLSRRRPAGDGPGPQTGGCSRPRPYSMAASAPQRLSPDKDTRQRKSQALHQGVCSAQCAPPSPVHLALRQVWYY